MIQADNPVQLAEDLRKLGLDASHEIVYGPRGYQEGVDVGDDFFPDVGAHSFRKIRRRWPSWILERSKRAAAWTGR